VSGLVYQLPIIGGNGKEGSLCGAFPHCVGIFDAPVGKNLPIMVPELTIDGHALVPSFYGKNITTGMRLGQGFQFCYEQPELIDSGEKIIVNVASCKVTWTFHNGKVIGDFIYTPKRVIRLDRFRFIFVVTFPHSRLVSPMELSIGDGGLRPQVIHDDFGADWRPLEETVNDSDMCTFLGKICYLYSYERDLPLRMMPNKYYRFCISFDPDVKVGQ
jgi:hypothetical protein